MPTPHGTLNEQEDSPRPGVWLVLSSCHRCDPKTGRYCHPHGGRRDDKPAPAADPARLAEAQAEEIRRIGGDA